MDTINQVVGLALGIEPLNLGTVRLGRKTNQLLALRKLRKEIPHCVDVRPETRYNASFDGSKLAFPVDAVVRPRTKKELSLVLALANQYRVPLTVRGGGSSLTGSASPRYGGWVLCLDHWNKLSIDAEQGLAKVKCGAKIADIQRSAEAAGWFYPPDPSSREYCTIGGTIACNAGGMHGGKYGVTRDYILALEGFLPNGAYVRGGGYFKKFACGYNLRDLWIGSEGTLGIITDAVLRLIPKPEDKFTMVAAFANESAAIVAVRSLLATRIQPSILEFLDRHSVHCAETVSPEPLFPSCRGLPLLLIEVDGHPAQVSESEKALESWARHAQALATRGTRDPVETEVLWSARRKCSGAMFALGDAKLNEDVVVPLSRQQDFMLFLERLQKSCRLPIATFGHAADGNFHVNIMYHRENEKESLRARTAVLRLMKKVVSLGGTITGEHGIGLAKSPFLRLDRSGAEIAAMQAIKKALDPAGILNPGKLFDPYEVWQHRPEKVRLAWDH